MIWAVIYGVALAIGWLVSILVRGGTEQKNMCILTASWLGTLFVDYKFGANSTGYYIGIDAAVLIWLYYEQEKNWQWIIAALFTAMMLTHFVFIAGQILELISNTPRPYKDILAILGYLAIGTTITLGLQRLKANGGAF